jgi:hypothetical protein
MLFGSAPDVDAAESDLVAQINSARAAQGLAPAVLDVRLSRAADLQATWLASGVIGLALPALSHLGPFGTTPAFRLGEVSFPEPATGGEIASGGATPAEAMTMWLASAPHRDQLLAPVAPLIGVGEAGSVIIVDLHAPCGGCQALSPGAGAPGALSPAGVPAATSAGVKAGAPTGPSAPNHGSSSSASSPSSSSSSSSCRVEQMRVQHLRTLHGRLRLSVGVQCLRPGARYTLSVLQRPSRSLLATRRVRGAGTLLLALRPSRTTRSLRVKLKRNGRAVLARSVSRRRVNAR